MGGTAPVSARRNKYFRAAQALALLAESTGKK